MLLVIATVAMAVTAWFQYAAHIDPHVVVYTAADPRRSQMILLVIHNTGRGVAYDVKFSLDRALPSHAFYAPQKGGKQERYDAMKVGPLVTGIAALGPDDKRVVTWGMYNGLIAALGPEAVRVTAIFESRGSHPWNPRRHEVDSYLDVASFDANDASRSELRQVVHELGKIAANTEKLAHAARLMTPPEAAAADAKQKEADSALQREALLRFLQERSKRK